jgi:hypothetical protein
MTIPSHVKDYDSYRQLQQSALRKAGCLLGSDRSNSTNRNPSDDFPISLFFCAIVALGLLVSFIVVVMNDGSEMDILMSRQKLIDTSPQER